MASQIGGADYKRHDEANELKLKLLFYYKELANSYFNFDNSKISKIKFDIEKIELKLQKNEFQNFWNSETNSYISFARHIKENAIKTKKMIFNIRESTGTGNYKLLENWNITEIYNYIALKDEQVKKLNEKIQK